MTAQPAGKPAGTKVQKAPKPLEARLPPHSDAIEEAVLGVCLVDPKGFETVSSLLLPDAFYNTANRAVYNACAQLHARGEMIDMVTVCRTLETMGKIAEVGGPANITRLCNGIVTGVNVQAWAAILMQKYTQREVIRISSDMLNSAYDDKVDVYNLLAGSEKNLLGLTNHYLNKDFSDSVTVLADVLTRVDYLRTRKDTCTGIPSGFACVDDITYGWQPGDLIVLAARPGVGKTAFALNLARNACLHAEKPVAVGFFSLEMSAAQIMQRMLSAETGVPLQNIMRGNMQDDEYDKFIKNGVRPVERAGIFIDDTPALTLFELRTKARRMVQKHKVGFIVVDYLQLMNGQPGYSTNREQEISTISRGLKAIAKELAVPVMALSQLSRAVETRHGTKMPQLSDLRESGAIEQDADVVMFIYRPAYYDAAAPTGGNAGSAPVSDVLPGETHIKFAKHRNGAVGDIVKLRAQLHIQKFENLPLQNMYLHKATAMYV